MIQAVFYHYNTGEVACRTARCSTEEFLQPDVHPLWTAWFEAHGIDPANVALPLRVECDDVNRRIRYPTPELDPSHPCGVLLKPDKDGFMQPVNRTIEVQLESRAMPFPALPGTREEDKP